MRSVIDIKQSLLADRTIDKNDIFTVGHSSTKSETFFPTFRYLKDSDVPLAFLDVAGLNDTSGPFLDLVAHFIL